MNVDTQIKHFVENEFCESAAHMPVIDASSYNAMSWRKEMLAKLEDSWSTCTVSSNSHLLFPFNNKKQI